LAGEDFLIEHRAALRVRTTDPGRRRVRNCELERRRPSFERRVVMPEFMCERGESRRADKILVDPYMVSAATLPVEAAPTFHSIV
jgi:hypothetical protein